MKRRKKLCKQVRKLVRMEDGPPFLMAEVTVKVTEGLLDLYQRQENEDFAFSEECIVGKV